MQRELAHVVRGSRCGRGRVGRGCSGAGRQREHQRAPGRANRLARASTRWSPCPPKPHTPSVARALPAAFVLLAAAILGCRPTSPVEQAFEAQGGRLGAFTREVEAKVHYGFPGTWHWEFVYTPPLGFRMTVITGGAPQRYVFDGDTLESRLGDALVGRDTGDAPAYRSIARWLGVTSLEILADRSRVSWEEAGGRELGRGVERELEVRFRDGGASYRLGFDAEGHLLAARGPIEIPGVGAGRLEARYRDFRTVGGRAVPFAASYRLNGEPFLDERVIRFVPGAGPDGKLPGSSIRSAPTPP